MTTDIEKSAIAFGADSKRVEARLRSASKLLLIGYRSVFAMGATFHADKRMLISADENWALVWQLRAQPDQPIGYGNQQTTNGSVFFVKVGAFECSPNNH